MLCFLYATKHNRPICLNNYSPNSLYRCNCNNRKTLR